LGSREPYKVIRCPSCGWLQVVMAEKTSTCRRCGRRMDLSKTEPLAVAESAEEARMALLRLKERDLKSRQGCGSIF